MSNPNPAEAAAPDLPQMVGPYRNRITGLRVMPLAEVQEHPQNWRTHPPVQRNQLHKVMSDVGFVLPLILNTRSDRLLDGHLRRTLIGTDPQAEVVVILVDLDEEEERTVLATLDPLGTLAGLDENALASLLDGMDDVSAVLDTLGEAYGHSFLEELLLPADEMPPVPEPEDPDADDFGEVRVRPGDLWLIESQRQPGKAHRLLCGDSTDAATVQRLMDGQRAALFATDPPYLVDYDGTNHPHKWNEDPTTKNKDWSATYHDWDDSAQGEGLYDGFVAMAVEHAITENAAWYCWHASRNQAMLEAVWQQHGAFVHQQIIWVKDRPVLTRSWYMWQHEPCFMGWVKGNKPRRTADDHPRSVWEIPTIQPGQSTDHPTSKPVEVFAIPMQQHTLPGDICYEPFAGSGSQHAAGEQLGRIVYGIEKQPRYCEVILRRLEAMGLEVTLAERIEEESQQEEAEPAQPEAAAAVAAVEAG